MDTAVEPSRPRATARRLALGSTPVTDPLGPTSPANREHIVPVPLPTSTTASPSFGDALVKAHSRSRMMPAALSWWSNRRTCSESASARAPSSVGRLNSRAGIDSSDETSSSDDMANSVTPLGVRHAAPGV